MYLALVLIALFIITNTLVAGDNNEDGSEDLASLFECGLNPFKPSRTYMSVQFIFIALVFIVFDLEVLFLLVALHLRPAVAST